MPAVSLAATPDLAPVAEPAKPRPVPSASVGPAESSDITVLWTDARRAFGEGRYSDAAFRLERLVQRHPGFESFLEAQLMLGISLMRMGRAAEAVAPLKQYVASMGSAKDGYRARLALARAYIATGKFHEALLSAIEVLDAAAAGRIPGDLAYEALILKTKCHLGLKQEVKASRTLSSADSAWSKLPEPEQTAMMGLRAESLWSALELKLRECRELAPRPPALEAAVMASTEKRGSCLSEAVVVFANVLDTKDPHWSNESVAALAHGYEEFWKDCMDPPSPPGKRSATQASQYKTELVGLLRGRCTDRIEKGLALLEPSASSTGVEHRNALARRVRGLYGDSN